MSGNSRYRRSGIALQRQPFYQRTMQTSTYTNQFNRRAAHRLDGGQDQADEEDLFAEAAQARAFYEIGESQLPVDTATRHHSLNRHSNHEGHESYVEETQPAYTQHVFFDTQDSQKIGAQPGNHATADPSSRSQQPVSRWDLSRFSHDHSDPAGARSQYTSTPDRDQSFHCDRETSRTREHPRAQSVYQLETAPSEPFLDPPVRRSAHFQPRYLTEIAQVSQSGPSQYVQGIEIITTHALPDRFRAIFPFPNFNAMQSKCFRTMYNTNDNFVLSSPTGSGKTVIFELAICRIISLMSAGQYKVVYQAPTKSLCAERVNDWQQKFRLFDIECAELTGDTDSRDLAKVQNATIIVTTPEKFDSMTRKWKDHEKLLKMVKLFLIDEVHMLKEDRGATLEAVVSRMKSVNTGVRFVALSATIPNSEDIADWLGKDSLNNHLPAPREYFGEEFRPVMLEKHVEGFQSNGNDFAFDTMLTTRLPSVIAKYSKRKPIMVFCMTRKISVAVAEALTNWWSTKNLTDRHWSPPHQQIVVHDAALKHCVPAAVAFHHGGMGAADRDAVENGFRAGNINVVCCTSTLAVGVNLPCHLVIIKNTVTWQASGTTEYSDLEIMQMIGRAGRPQYDKNATAVIMTRQDKARKYQIMVSGHEPLESRLHLNLIDHLNAEIALGTIKDLTSAKIWLQSTFLYVRMRRNFCHYQLGDDNHVRSLDEKVETILQRGINLLQETELVTNDRRLASTHYGQTAARYYVQFKTAQTLLGLEPKAKISEILSGLCQASEFEDLRFRSGEKQAYKDLNKSGRIAYPIPVNLELPAHKVSLIIQAQLALVDFATDVKTSKHRQQYLLDTALVFQHINRLIRCYIDFQLETEDSIAIRNALRLARSLGPKCWDDSPFQLRQIQGIGPASIRKFVQHNINSIADLEACDAQKIETILSRNPPYGLEFLRNLKSFPKLRVSVQMVGQPSWKAGQGATIQLRATVGFLNDPVSYAYHGKVIHVIFLAETSDGRKICFARNSARKIGDGQDFNFKVTLVSPLQEIHCHVMGDEFAGTQQSLQFKPTIPSLAWPKEAGIPEFRPRGNPKQRPSMNISARRNIEGPSRSAQQGEADTDDFGNDDIDDDDLAGVEAGNRDAWTDVDEILDNRNLSKQNRKRSAALAQQAQESEPTKLANGNWRCNHPCSQKGTCKHTCCEQGMNHRPKSKKTKIDEQQRVSQKPVGTPWRNAAQNKPKPSQLKKGQTTLNLPKGVNDLRARSPGLGVPEIDLTDNIAGASGWSAVGNVRSVADRPQKINQCSRLGKAQEHLPMHNPPNLLENLESDSLYRAATPTAPDDNSYGDWPEDILIDKTNDFTCRRSNGEEHVSERGDRGNDADDYNDEDSLLDAMIGLADSQHLEVENSASQPGIRSNHMYARTQPKASLAPRGPENTRLPREIDDAPSSSSQAPSVLNLRQSKGTSPLDTIEGAIPGIEHRASENHQTQHTETSQYNPTEKALISGSAFLYDRKATEPARETSIIQSTDQIESVERGSVQVDIAPWLLQEFGQYVDFI